MSRLKAMSLKQRMMLAALSALAVMFLAVGLVFLRTTRSLQQSTVEAVGFMADELRDSVDGILRDVQNTSELFADDNRVYDNLDHDFTDTDEAYKLMFIRLIRNTIFISYNRPEQTEISAIYNDATGELFNFIGGPMGEDEIARLLELEITSQDKLSMTCWYPLQDNFLAAPTGEVRQDTAVIGSRRIYRMDRRNPYPYVQIFTIREGVLYDLYAGLAAQTSGEVYIVNEDGGLISASSEDAVRSRTMDTAVLEAAASTPEGGRATVNGQEYFIFSRESEFTNRQFAGNGWSTILLVPVEYAFQGVQGLYLAFIGVLLLCVLLSAVLLMYLYRQFMNPISNLGAAMKRVDEGDFAAYLDTPAPNSEMGAMIRRYNHMLGSINRNMQDKIAYEKRTRDLDMQVLVSQVNPHFLYNTIETIVWKANMAGHPDIGKLASALGRLYRLSISGGSNWVPLSQEIAHVHSYVEIQKARFEGQFTYVPPVVDEATAAVMIPKIILQPIVENAFLYAVLESDSPVTIRVRVRAKGDTLVVTVTDNGCGMDKARLAAVRRQIETGEKQPEEAPGYKRSTGIGLHNISARLELYMNASDALKIYSKKGLGTKIVVVLPVQQTGDKT